MKHRITDIIARVLIFIPALAVIITSVSFPGYVPSYNNSVYDINGDGEVTDTDVKYVLALSASLSSDIPSEIKLSADVNGDSIINADDARLVSLNITTPSVYIQEAAPVEVPLVDNNFASP